MISDQPINFDRFVRLLLTLAIIAGLFLLLRKLSDVLLPFLLAWLTAYLLDPMVAWVQKWVKRRGLAVFCTLFTILALISVLMIFMVPAIASEAQHLYGLLSSQVQAMQWPAWLPSDMAARVNQYLGQIDYRTLLEQEGVADKLMSVLSAAWQALAGIYGVIGALAGLVTYFIYLVFILIDYHRLSSGWIVYVPPKYRDFIQTLVADMATGMNGYFRAQTKIVVIVSILFAIGFKVIALPFGIVLGIFVGLLNYVPYLQIAGMIPAVALAALKSLETGQDFWVVFVLVLVVFAIVQLAQDVYITPRIMGNLTGMNPAIILLSLSVWGSLLGFVGLIIAIPLTSLLLTYYNRYVIKTHPPQA